MLFRVTIRVSWLIRTNLMWLFFTKWRQLKLPNFTLPRIFLSKDAADHALNTFTKVCYHFQSFSFSNRTFLSIHSFSHSCSTFRPSPHLFITRIYWWTVQIVDLPVTQLFSASDYCLPLNGTEAEARIVLSSEWFAPVFCSPYTFSTVRHVSVTKWQCCTRDWNM